MTAQHCTEFGIVVAAGHRYARWYDDGPSPSRYDGSDPIDVEEAYRTAFLEAASEVAEWGEPDDRAVEAAWRARCDANDAARVSVPSADYFGVTDPGRRSELIGEQTAYRLAHAITAARARGRHQALATSNDAWSRLSDRGVSSDQIVRSLLPAWLAEVQAWATQPAKPEVVAVPPVLDETEAALRLAAPHAVTRTRASLAQCASDEAASPRSFTTEPPTPQFISVRQLMAACPALRPPIINKLLREGETMNIIAAPKTGKSWLTLDLALSVASGRPWLGRYETTPGEVLIIDNELHRETSASRVPQVARARGLDFQQVGWRVAIDNLRGRLRDIFALRPYFDRLEPGRFRLIILDAFYRFMPLGGDENDNATMAGIYNAIDAYADRLGCAFVLIHHSTKGNQSSKSVTDVGAGAGSQSRATDSHLVLRPHEESGCVVLDAAVRSWAPIDPAGLRWSFPVWDFDPSLDPTQLRQERPSKRKAEKQDEADGEAWDVERFVGEFITAEPVTLPELRERAASVPGLSWRRVGDFLAMAERRGLIGRVRLPGRGGPQGFVLSTEEAPS